jgi:hypothetical protein
VIAQAIKLSASLLEQRQHYAIFGFALRDDIHCDIRHFVCRHFQVTLAADRRAAQQRAHVLLVQRVRLLYPRRIELHAQVRPAIHRVHEPVRLPAHAAHAAQLHKEVAGRRRRRVAGAQRVQRTLAAAIEAADNRASAGPLLLVTCFAFAADKGQKARTIR